MDVRGRRPGSSTDRTCERSVVAVGRDAAATPAATIMSAPLVTLRRRLRVRGGAGDDASSHPPRRGGGRGSPAGRRLEPGPARAQAAHPVALARDIERAARPRPWPTLASRVTALVRRLVDEAGSAYDIGQIVAELNDRMVGSRARPDGRGAGGGRAAGARRALLLARLRQRGRREQTLRTDQDNGLVYQDPRRTRRRRRRLLRPPRRGRHLNARGRGISAVPG